MLSIKLENNMIIESDQNQFLLKHNITSEKNTEYQAVLGYYGTLEQALQAYIKKCILISDASSIKEVLTLLVEIKNYIRETVGV